jgi:phage/plasmid-like protein (TIGR03299 family)
MAHELEIIGGKASIAFACKRDAVWHRLGQEITPDASIKEWMQAAGLDWTVSKRQIMFVGSDGMLQEVESHKALVRDTDESFFDVVTNEWTPIQNIQMFEFFQRFAEHAGIRLHTAGSLRGGRDVWVMGKLDKAFELPGGDLIEHNVLFNSPHQAGKAAQIIPTPIVVVCANTQGWALRKHERQARKLEARFIHVGDNRYSHESAMEQLGVIVANADAFEERARFLHGRRCTDETFSAFISRVYNLTELTSPEFDADRVERRRRHNQRVIDQMKEIRETQPKIESGNGSWWQAYNAVTFDVDHSPRRNIDDDRILSSAWLGHGARRKDEALQIAVEMAS